MAAQGFLLIATFLLVLMVLARPLGSGLAQLQLMTFLFPVQRALSAYFFAHLASLTVR
ncbi:hypothetical protein ACLB1M_08035 [Escherichia coli]